MSKMNISSSIKKQNAKGELPAGWRRVRLGDVGEFRAAGVDKKIVRGQNKSLLVNYLDVLNNDFINNKMLNHWVTASDHQISNCEVKIGDILFTPSSEIQGDIAHSAVITEKIKCGVYSYHIFRYRLKENWNLKYRGYAFKSPHFYRQANRLCQGSGQRYTLSMKDFQDMSLLVPTINKQKQIASIISTWDDAIEKTELLIAAQEHQFKGLINSLLNDKTKQKNWTLVKLGEICEIKNGSTPRKTDESFWKNGDIPWFTVADIRRQGRIINNTTQFITKEALKKSSIYLLPPNSVLICCTASIGEHAFTTIPLTTNQQFNGLTIKKEKVQNIYPEYLFYASYLLKRELSKLGGKTSFTHVPISLVANIYLSIPPIKEQEKIITCLSTCQNVINQSQKLLNEYKKQKKALMQKLFIVSDISNII